MNKYIKFAMIFTAGLGIGGGVSYFVCKKHFDDRLTDELEKNQEYMIECLGYRSSGYEKDIPTQTTMSESTTLVTEEFDPEAEIEKKKTYVRTGQLNALKEKFLNERGKVRYDKIPPEYKEEEVDPVTLAVNNDQPLRDINIITADQFAREHLGFEKTTLLWWPKNKIMSTEDYDILDIPDLVGTEWPDRIGEFEPDIVYVRNFTAETDYEIVQQHGDYYEYTG